MTRLIRPHRYSGGIRPDDVLHKPVDDPAKTVAPIQVEIKDGFYVPQYAPTVRGAGGQYDPAGDCGGNFMPSSFKVNNNCYAYACDIATNSWPQPGRKHGHTLAPPYVGDDVVNAAKADGLIFIGGPELRSTDLPVRRPAGKTGHFVALLISQPAENLSWQGDYHWVRCDDNDRCLSWSQKDGDDAITNFDFAGRPIEDPRHANWVVNYGKLIENDPRDVVVAYKFHAFLFAPRDEVDII